MRTDGEQVQEEQRSSVVQLENLRLAIESLEKDRTNKIELGELRIADLQRQNEHLAAQLKDSGEQADLELRLVDVKAQLEGTVPLSPNSAPFE